MYPSGNGPLLIYVIIMTIVTFFLFFSTSITFLLSEKNKSEKIKIEGIH
jgi:hypothetical protein